MPRWLGDMLKAVRRCARQGSVRVTHKAMLEMAEFDPEVTPDDAVQILESLARSSFRYRVRSERTGEWMYILRVRWCGERIYLKLLLRTTCTIVSFHPEGSAHELEEDESAAD